jgi:hypothetical protein
MVRSADPEFIRKVLPPAEKRQMQAAYLYGVA